MSLPEDVRAAYRWHDGCASELSIFVDLAQWCSLEEMVSNWTMMVRVSTSDRVSNPGNWSSALDLVPANREKVAAY